MSTTFGCLECRVRILELSTRRYQWVKSAWLMLQLYLWIIHCVALCYLLVKYEHLWAWLYCWCRTCSCWQIDSAELELVNSIQSIVQAPQTSISSLVGDILRNFLHEEANAIYLNSGIVNELRNDYKNYVEMPMQSLFRSLTACAGLFADAQLIVLRLCQNITSRDYSLNNTINQLTVYTLCMFNNELSYTYLWYETITSDTCKNRLSTNINDEI